MPNKDTENIVAKRSITIKCCGDIFKIKCNISKDQVIEPGTVVDLKIGSFSLEGLVRKLKSSGCIYEGIFAVSEDRDLWEFLSKK